MGLNKSSSQLPYESRPDRPVVQIDETDVFSTTDLPFEFGSALLMSSRSSDHRYDLQTANAHPAAEVGAMPQPNAEAQVCTQMQALKAELPSRCVIQGFLPTDIDVQMQAETQTQGQGQAQSVAREKHMAQAYLLAQAQLHAQAWAQTHAQIRAQAQALAQIQVEAQLQAQAKAQAHAQAQAQAKTQAHSEAQRISQVLTHTQGQSYALTPAQAHAIAIAQAQAQAYHHVKAPSQDQIKLYPQAHPLGQVDPHNQTLAHAHAQGQVPDLLQMQMCAYVRAEPQARSHEQTIGKQKGLTYPSGLSQARAVFQVPLQLSSQSLETDTKPVMYGQDTSKATDQTDAGKFDQYHSVQQENTGIISGETDAFGHGTVSRWPLLDNGYNLACSNVTGQPAACTNLPYNLKSTKMPTIETHRENNDPMIAGAGSSVSIWSSFPQGEHKYEIHDSQDVITLGLPRQGRQGLFPCGRNLGHSEDAQVPHQPEAEIAVQDDHKSPISRVHSVTSNAALNVDPGQEHSLPTKLNLDAVSAGFPYQQLESSEGTHRVQQALPYRSSLVRSECAATACPIAPKPVSRQKTLRTSSSDTNQRDSCFGRSEKGKDQSLPVLAELCSEIPPSEEIAVLSTASISDCATGAIGSGDTQDEEGIDYSREFLAKTSDSSQAPMDADACAPGDRGAKFSQTGVRSVDDSDADQPTETLSMRVDKRQSRAKRNRESADRSRRKKRERSEFLEREVGILRQELQSVCHENHDLRKSIEQGQRELLKHLQDNAQCQLRLDELTRMYQAVQER
jgi:bZIP transcription factor